MQSHVPPELVLKVYNQLTILKFQKIEKPSQYLVLVLITLSNTYMYGNLSYVCLFVCFSLALRTDCESN